MSSEERRQIRRFKVWVPVRIEVGDEAVEGRVFDISGTGGFVECGRVWPAGTGLTLTLEPPGDAPPQSLRARVVRVEQTERIEGMGLAFSDVKESASAFMELFTDLLSQRRAESPDEGSSPPAG